jgi:single-strand DNA-binding protein
MANGLNKVFLIGNIIADGEQKNTQNGNTVLNFRLATNEYGGKDDAGNAKTATEYHLIVVWGNRAQALTPYIKKGKQIYVEGRLHTYSYEDESGAKRYVTQVVANDVILLGSAAGQASGNGKVSGNSQASAPAEPAIAEPAPAPIAEDDLPF